MTADKHQDYMYGLLKRVLDDIGPRPSCGSEEKALAELLRAEWEPICTRVDVEDFQCHPGAFLGAVHVYAVMYLAALALYMFVPLLSSTLLVIGAGVFFLELVRYYELTDALYPRARGENLLGIIEPEQKATKRLIVCAHLDSAWEFNLFYWMGDAAVVGLISSVLAYGVLFAAGVGATLTSPGMSVFFWMWVATAVFSPMMLLLFAFHTYSAVPGAMDDLAGIAVVAGLGRWIDSSGKNGQFKLQNTEVVLFAASAEEAGLRGSKRYVERHLKELKSLPTNVLVIDGVADENFLTVVTKELWTGARHSPSLIKAIEEIAGEHQWPIKTMPIVMGGTDATPFSQNNIPAVIIGCQDLTRLVPNYHTRLDTIDHVSPQSMVVTLQVTIDLLRRLDTYRRTRTG
ncbi:MAG: M28 family peptidase [Proteobacteria bacterium]|nr:M28 family peptidase [Pseudomonadota bacterium]